MLSVAETPVCKQLLAGSWNDGFYSGVVESTHTHTNGHLTTDTTHNGSERPSEGKSESNNKIAHLEACEHMCSDFQAQV